MIRNFTQTVCLGLIASAAVASAWAWDFRVEGQPLALRQESGEFAFEGAPLSFAALPNGTLFLGANTLVQVIGPYRYRRVTGARDSAFGALAVEGEKRVWVGSGNDLGFVEADATGEFQFQSLREPFVRDVGQGPRNVTAIFPVPGSVWVVDAAGVYRLADDRFRKEIDATAGRVHPLRPTPASLWLRVPGRGVVALQGNALANVLPADALPADLIWLLAATADAAPIAAEPQVGEGWLAGSADAVFVRRDGAWAKLEELSRLVSSAVATTAIALESGHIAIGTQNQGVLIATRDGRVVSRLNRDQALLDNRVHVLAEDPRGDLLVGTAAGFSRIVPTHRISALEQAREFRGGDLLRALASVGGRLYAVNSTGVFRVESGSSPSAPSSLVQLPITPGPGWALTELGGDLVASGTGGIWRLRGSGWETLHQSDATIAVVLRSQSDARRLYFCDGSQVKVMEVDATGHRSIALAAELGEAAHSMVEAPDGSKLIALANGEVLVARDRSGAKLEFTRKFSPGAGLPVEAKRLRLVRFGERILGFDEATAVALRTDLSGFQPIADLAPYRVVTSTNDATRESGLLIVESRRFVGFRRSVVARLSVGPDDSWQLVPLATDFASMIGRTAPADVQVTPAGSESVVWYAASRGLLRLGASPLEPAPLPPMVRFTSITTSATVTRGRIGDPARLAAGVDAEEKRLRLNEVSPALSPATQVVRFEFTGAGPAGELPFQSRLIGLEAEWGNPVPIQVREFTGLAPGRYEFEVRAFDPFARPTPSISYPFAILRPWYLRWPAWLAYLALAALGAWGGYRWRVRQLRRQNERLNRMVAERTRELALANAHKMDFLASISHEIRNPLNGITGLVNLLNTAALGNRERELASSLAACSRSLRRVFDEVLGFARLEQGEVTLRERPFSVRRLLEEVCELFAVEAGQRGNTLVVRVSDENLALVGDAEKIRTVLHNFVGNALKYAPGTVVEIEAQVETRPDGLAAASFQVRDHGPGIAPEEQELVFRKFVRGSTAAIRREPGAGLGLATCQALAHVMGGHVGVESSTGSSSEASGSTFYLQLNLPVATGAPAEPEPFPGLLPAEAAPAISTVRYALVVEDQEYNQLVARNVLERLGYVAEVAADAAAARKRFGAQEFDLVLLDWDVPGAKGDDLARELRALPRGEKTIVVALTAHDSDEIRALCRQSGMDGFLVKPLEEALLSETVRDVRARRTKAGATGRNAFEIFDYLGRGDAARARAAAEEYLAQLERELSALHEGIAARDNETIARRAHRVRAHAAVVRFQPLTEAARRLQEAASVGGDSAGAAEEVVRHGAQLGAKLREHLR